jgi:transposase
VHAVLAKNGVAVPMSDLFGVCGTGLLEGLSLPPEYAARVVSLRRLIGGIEFEIDSFSKMIAARLVNDRGYHAIQALPGVGPILAAILVAEIGDVTRFTRAAQLCSWAGMTPRHRESDTKVHRGRITKQGSRLVRWACIEAVQRIHGGPLLGMRARLVETRGKGIAKVACARELLTLVFYGLRDGQIRCLAKQPAKEPA